MTDHPLKSIIDPTELKFSFIRASGPGGQKVNKTSSGVQLRFNAVRSPSLSPEIKDRLLKLAGSRATVNGEIVIEAARFRTQEANRKDALDRLTRLIRQAAHRPRRRRPTKPTQASRRRRLEAKKQRGQVKRLRRKPIDQ